MNPEQPVFSLNELFSDPLRIAHEVIRGGCSVRIDGTDRSLIMIPLAPADAVPTSLDQWRAMIDAGDE